MIINLQAKSVYGQIKFYPAGPFAQAVADTAGTKTIEPRILAIWAKQGAQVLIVDGNSIEAQTILANYGI
jgi:uncharacterized protein YfaP (DUF2135 family)